MDGASPGDFWLRGDINPIRSGTEGIIVVFAAMVRTWIVWGAGRTGFVEQLSEPPPDLEEGRTDTGRPCLVLPNGNTVEDTMQGFIICEGAPGIMPLTRGQARRFIDTGMLPTFRPPGRSVRCAVKSQLNEVFRE
jgi:hypothetical protein